jgi:hypothetical protein
MTKLLKEDPQLEYFNRIPPRISYVINRLKSLKNHSILLEAPLRTSTLYSIMKESENEYLY